MILVSACLLGENCKYSGQNNYSQAVAVYVADKPHLAFCPETAAGLPVPRLPIELRGMPADIMAGSAQAVNSLGEDVSAAFIRGAEIALDIARGQGVKLAILKDGSPSCGVHEIYDGSFSHCRIPGQGMTAAALQGAGIRVISEGDIPATESANPNCLFCP